MFPREMPDMRKAAVIAAVTALLLKGATAADFGDPAPGTPPIGDAGQANWHGGGHRGGGRDHSGGGDGSGDDGAVIVGFPYPAGPDAPYPYPSSPYPYPGAPSSPPGSPDRSSAARNSPSSQTQPWPVWYYCEQPNGYYPYVKVCTHDWKKLPVLPPPPGSRAPVADGLWEHCDAPEGYFPYIAQCRHPWVAAAPSSPVPGDDPDGIPIIANWFYCEDTKDYLPYVGSCPHIWHSIPAVPPPNVQSAAQPKKAADRR